VHADFFARVATEDRRIEFIYMVAMNRAAADAIPLLGDPAATVKQLSRRTPPPLGPDTVTSTAEISAVGLGWRWDESTRFYR
jgi:hypothetical protein